MRCCLMACLINVLSDIAPKPSTTFSFQICQNPKLQLDPTDSFYPEPPSSYDIDTARNPDISCNYFGLTEIAIGITEMARQTLCCLVDSLRSH